MLDMGDPQNQGFQSWNGLMTWMMWGYPILGSLHFVLRREGNFRCNYEKDTEKDHPDSGKIVIHNTSHKFPSHPIVTVDDVFLFFCRGQEDLAAEVISCTAKFPLRSSPRLMQSSAWAPGVACASRWSPNICGIVLHHPNEDIQDITRIYLG